MSRGKRSPSPFAKNLTALMAEKGLGVREGARIAGVAAGTITNWRSGVAPDDFLAVKKLAQALGTTLSFLLTGENDAYPSGPPAVAEVFNDGGIIFDGYAKITIQRLLPNESKKKPEGS